MHNGNMKHTGQLSVNYIDVLAIFLIDIFTLLTELVFNDHKRTVNKIQFHPFEKDILLSGSQDGTMKYFVSHFMFSKIENVKVS